MVRLRVNGRIHDIQADPRTPLLWVLRDHLGLTGTKYGCGIAACGSCTVHLDGSAFRSCVIPIEEVGDREVTTIEGLSTNGSHPVQRAWREHGVAQCGYCQPGQIMGAAAFLKEDIEVTDDAIDAAMGGNICRCGTYPRIRAAIKSIARSSR
jgi:isoquinoline 1-oxidoreductase alpha subunit